MSRWTPCKRHEFIRRLQKLRFEGPYSGTRHQFMVPAQYRLAIPPTPSIQFLNSRIATRRNGTK